MVTVHLICGSAGAGKTTYAIALAKRIGAVRLSTDEWMSVLFRPDRPSPPALAWVLERIDRCEQQMWMVAEPLVARGIDVVLDLAPSNRDYRDRMRGRVAQTRAQSKLHYLDVSRETRRARVLERSRIAQTGSAEDDQTLFALMDRWFEFPSDDELYGAMIVCED